MIALGAIKEAFKVYRKNKVLRQFALLTVTAYILLFRLTKFFSGELEFYGHFNYGTFFLTLLFLAIIEAGLIQGVDQLRLGKEPSLKGIYNLLWQSGKHLPFIYIFLMILLGAVFVFLSPFLCFPSAMMVAGNVFDTLGDNMVLFSELLILFFYFVTPLISRYFLLRGGTYWMSIVEGIKMFFGRWVDTLVFLVFFIISYCIQMSVPIVLSIIGLSRSADVDFGLTYRNVFLAADFIMSSTFVGIILIPLVSLIWLWWSATLTLYFQEIQEAAAEKPKWIRS